MAYSGQGIYVFLHHDLSRAPPDTTPEHRDQDYKVWMMAFNALLADVENQFFEDHPEHTGCVKFDKLNNQKRKVKCLLSIHRKLPFAVVPLDAEKIEIDFDEARIPLSSEVLERARSWIESWSGDDDERHALARLLRSYAENAANEIRERSEGRGSIFRSPHIITPEEWCPFYRNILRYGDATGKHRALGALAAWLYQAGWPEEAAFKLWAKVAAQANVETRIFGTSYGVINSPNCETIKSQSAGFPKLGFGDLGICCPDSGCKGCKWPGQHGNNARVFKDSEALGRLEKALKHWHRVAKSVKADPEKLNEPETLEALATIRANDGLRFLTIMKKLRLGEALRARLTKELDRRTPQTPTDTNGVTDSGVCGVSEDIRAEALEILKHGDPIKYLMDGFKELHVGDEKLGRVLLFSVASSYIKNSQGLQPKLSGRSGGGKTHACKSMVLLLPPEKVKTTSVSAKALYYLEDLEPGTIIFSDDIEMSPDLESTLKRSMTNYQEPTTHTTLDKDRKPITKAIDIDSILRRI